MKKIGIVLAILFLVFVVCGIGFWYVLIRETPYLAAELSIPGQVGAGETFEMVVTATNPHPGPVTLDSIDIDTAFLSGFQVLSVDPEQTSTDLIPFLDQRTWSFGQSVAPGDELSVRFKLKSIGPGHFAGSVDVCNPNMDFDSLYADVVVEEE